MKKLRDGFRLAEAPRFDPRWGLVVSDMVHGGVYALRDIERGSDIRTLIPHRRAVGGILIHAAGGLVVSGRSVTWRRGNQLEDRCDLLTAQPDEEFFNDMWADRRGQIYVGSVGQEAGAGERRDGRLYRIGLDARAVVLADDVKLSNGIVGSRDGRYIYHADTHAGLIWRYSVDGEEIGERAEFCDLTQREGGPDGLTCSSDGTLRVAMAGAGEVLHLDEHGRIIGGLSVGQPLVTAVGHAGLDLRTMVVTTGELGEQVDESGAVYTTSVDVPGDPVPEARVLPPSASAAQ